MRSVSTQNAQIYQRPTLFHQGSLDALTTLSLHWDELRDSAAARNWGRWRKHMASWHPCGVEQATVIAEHGWSTGHIKPGEPARGSPALDNTQISHAWHNLALPFSCRCFLTIRQCLHSSRGYYYNASMCAWVRQANSSAASDVPIESSGKGPAGLGLQ